MRKRGRDGQECWIGLNTSDALTVYPGNGRRRFFTFTIALVEERLVILLLTGQQRLVLLVVPKLRKVFCMA